MSTLTGKSPDATYKDLLQVSNANSGVDGTLRDVEDGEGTVSALKVSQNQMAVQPSSDSAALAEVKDASGTSLWKVDSTNGQIIQSVPMSLPWGQPPGGAKFDGVDDYYSIADDANLNFGTDDFAIELWLELSDYTPSANLVLVDKISANLGYRVTLLTTGAIRINFGNGTDVTTLQYDTAVLGMTDGDKQHIFLNFDRSANLTTYVNGVSKGTVAISGASSQTLDNAGALNIFTDLTNFTAGNMYEKRLWNVNPSASEIVDLYNNGRPDLAVVPYKYRGASQTNLVSDPGNEAALATLTTNASASGTISQSAAQAHTGTNSMLYTGNGITASGHWAGLRDIGQTLFTTAKEYYFEVWVYLPSGQSSTTLTAYVQENNGITSDLYLLGSTTTTDSWVKLSGTRVITRDNSGNYVAIIVFTNKSTANSDIFYLDDFLIKPVGVLYEARPESFGKFGLVDYSGNDLNANSSGSPISH